MKQLLLHIISVASPVATFLRAHPRVLKLAIFAAVALPGAIFFLWKPLLIVFLGWLIDTLL